MRWIKENKSLFFIIILFVGICAFMANRAVWFDESYSAQTIKGSFFEIAETTGADVHPPLYYYLLKLWAVPFGRSIVALRSFSIFCGVVAIIFAYLTFKRWSKSEKMASFLALAYAVCPFFIYYATEIRMYGLVCAIVMASVYFLDRALEEKKLKFWLIYALLFAAALYTHYFSAFAFLAEFIFVFFRYRKEDKKIVKKLLGVAVLALILFLPWLPSLFGQVSAVEKEYWIDPVNLNTLLDFFSESLIRYGEIVKNPEGLALVIATLIFLVITAASAFDSMGEKTREKTIYVAALVFIPLASLFILSIPPLSPVYVSRYLTYSSALLWVLAAILIAQTYGARPLLAKITGFLMLLCALAGFYNNYKENEYSASLDDVMAQIETIDDGKETPVIFDEATSAAFDAVYYQTEKHHVYIIDPMESWYASRPLSAYGDNYIADFDKFKSETESFWYVIPNVMTTSKTRKNFENEGFKTEYTRKIDGYNLYKFRK